MKWRNRFHEQTYRFEEVSVVKEMLHGRVRFFGSREPVRDRVAEGGILEVAVKLRVDVLMRGGEVRTFERLAEFIERRDLIARPEMAKLHDSGNGRRGDHHERRARR